MPKPLIELRDERAALAAETKRLVEQHPGDSWGTEQQRKYDSAVSRISAIDEEVERRQQALDIEAGQSFARRRGVGDSGPTVDGWVDGAGRPVAVYAPADRLSANNGSADQNGLTLGGLMRAMTGMGPRDALAVQALSEGSDSAGGVTVSPALTRDFIDRMRARTRVIQAGAMTVPLGSERTSIARIASDPTAGWRAELGAVAESEPTFDKVEFVARSLAVKLPVSAEVLADSLNIEAALRTALAGAFAVEVDRVALAGSGTAPEPEGVANVPGIASIGMATNGAALANYSKILQAFQAIADSNGPEPTAMIMAPRTRYALAGLTASDGQPLNAPKLIADVPQYDTTNLPVNETHGTATNASRLIVGDFSQLLIGVRQGLRIEVLRHTLADSLTYTFVAHLRLDIGVAQPNAFAQVTGITP